jgi:hypothetical protein
MFSTGNHGFDIRHFGVRHGDSEIGPDQFVGWIDVNIIFTISEEFRGYADSASQEWVSTVIYKDISNPKQITDWYESMYPWTKHPNRIKGLTMNDRAFLQYLPRFGVYQFHEIVENNQITTAALRELHALHGENIQVNSRFVPISRLMRSLETLSLFWD